MRHPSFSSSHPFVFAALVFLAVLAAAVPPAAGQERLIKGAPAQLTPLPVPGAATHEDANLVVTDVMIDKTAENAVLAREQAIAEARRVAFQRLAERHLTPAAYATFRVPDDRTIATLVQDFEIKGEQLSASRYVASFSVRFRDAVRQYIDVPPAPRAVVSAPPSWTESGSGAQGWDGGALSPDHAGTALPHPVQPDRAAVGTPQVTAPVLLLPYYENMAGQTQLWEDPNPWRDAWQRMPGRGAPSSFLSRIVVPLGDIADVSAGSSNAVWSGDYRALERLRAHYGVSQVVLAVANKSGAHMSIDIYFYERGRLQRRSALAPYVGEKSDAEAWRQAVYDVLAYLQSPAPSEDAAIASISRSVIDSPSAQGTSASVVSPYETGTGVPGSSSSYGTGYGGTGYGGGAVYGGAAPAGAAQEVEAMLSFSDFNAWMNVQRRFSAMSPPVRIDIRSLSRNNARFVMRYEGSVHGLQSALAAQGIVMTPSREVTTSYGTPVYDLRLHP